MGKDYAWLHLGKNEKINIIKERLVYREESISPGRAAWALFKLRWRLPSTGVQDIKDLGSTILTNAVERAQGKDITPMNDVMREFVKALNDNKESPLRFRLSGSNIA